jgi:predicted transcriptional regulator
MKTKTEKNISGCSNQLRERIDFNFYKTLFDPVRIELLIYLLANGSKNIKEITKNFSQDRSVISRHLDLMHRYGIVRKSKENRNIYYEASSRVVIDKFEETTNNIKKLMLFTSPKKLK